MCGICGIAADRSGGAREGVLRMRDRLGHRGPDARGIESIPLVRGRELALGHCRLSILDLSAAANQPMQDPGTGNRIVFNGEIYNYPDLRDRLLGQGVPFSTTSDTEVLLKTYAQMGVSFLKLLKGMFAFALYDSSRNRLLLARDPMGIKPLYYAWTSDGSFVFASEIRALAASGLVDCEIDRAALGACLAYGAVQEPLTMLKGVRLLKAGEWMEVDVGDPFNKLSDYGRFWSFPEPGSFEGTREEAVSELRKRADLALAGHLLSDVPVGLFLSAGIDSAAIASVCRRLGRTVESWTFSLEGGGPHDESAAAAEVARQFGFPHRTVSLSPGGLVDEVTGFVSGLDQPTVDGFNTWLMARACRAFDHKVAFSGLGGDELFGGYAGLARIPRLHRASRLLYPFSEYMRSMLSRAISFRLTPCQREKLEDLLSGSWSLNEMALLRRRLFSRAALERLGFGDVTWNLGPAGLPLECDLDSGTSLRFPIAAAGVVDARFYMRNMLLRDADVCGMAHGVEIRVPWLDQGVADLALSLPGHWRQPLKGINKPLLVEAAGVPSAVAHRRKTGFNLPCRLWLQGELKGLRERVVENLAGLLHMNAPAARRVFDEFDACPAGPGWSRAWMLTVLGLWAEGFVRWGKRGV